MSKVIKENDVIFDLKESNNYQRIYANDVYMMRTPRDEVHIDFFEEYIDSTSLMGDIKKVGDSYVKLDDDDFSDDLALLKVVREKKVSIVLEKREAYYLAKNMLERLEKDEDIKELIEEQDKEGVEV